MFYFENLGQAAPDDAYFTLQSHSWAELQPFENFKNGPKKGRFSALVTAAPWKFRTRLPNYRTNASPTRTDSGLPSGNSVATEFRVARQTHFIKLCHFLPIFRFFSTFLSIKYSKYKLQRTIHIPFRSPGRARFADANIYANVLPASPRFCQNVKNGVLPLFKFFEKNF